MKTTTLSALVVAAAALVTPDSASAVCSNGERGREVTMTNPRTHITLTVCLDGKYTTCVRDSQRFGNTKQEAIASCDEKRRQGRVK